MSSIEQKDGVKLADLLSSSEEHRFILPVEDFSTKQIIGNGRLRFIKRAADIIGSGVITGTAGFLTTGGVLALAFGLWGTPLLVLSGAIGLGSAGAGGYEAYRRGKLPRS